MTIRTTTPDDLEQILQIYAYARAQMRRNGNPTNGETTGLPPPSCRRTSEKGQSHVIEKDGHLCAVFTFIIGDDPTYQTIEQGRWLDTAPYGTIHRLAGNGTAKGIFRQCLSYCMAQIPNIRIDTHRDNAIMQHLLEKNGFVKCGIIYVEDGSPRIAYQKRL